MKNIKIYMLLAATMLMVAACGSDDDETTGGGKNPKELNVNKNDTNGQPEVARLEFPRLKDGKNVVIVHTTNDSFGLNYCTEWDYEKMSQRWSCYQMYKGYGGDAGRYEGNPQYPFDEDLKAIETKTGIKMYWDDDLFRGSGYDHGHICPSADRQYSKQANRQTFYLTNMQPQYANFNQKLWAEMENRMRKWIANSPATDTMYVCKGGTIDDEQNIIERVKGQLIVPKYFYMAILYKNSEGYKALAFWAQNENVDRSKDDLKKYVISIDRLEELTGIDFFCNLPDETENKVEAVTYTQSWKW
ncbi:MAG: DNA/RNA non-specific endonuclease [Prevotella sp.]|nr:DNA/RNA non-specific endonuclease [Prevotella sp.]